MRKQHFCLLFAGPMVIGLALPGAAETVQKVVVSNEQCAEILDRHVPSADYQPGVDAEGNKVASTEYEPGVDAEGNKVASADLDDPSALQIPDEISFDISPKLYQLLGVTPPLGLEDTAIKVGTVKVKLGGAIMFNGKRLDGPQIDGLIELCRARKAKK